MKTRTIWIAAALLGLLGVVLLSAAATSWGEHDAPVTSSSRPSPTAASPSSTAPNVGGATAAGEPSRAVPTAVSSSSNPKVAPGEQDLAAWSTPDPAQARLEAVAVAKATAAVAAFARPPADSDPGQWAARVQAAVAPEAWQQLNGVDPARVTYTRVTGPGRVLQQDDEQPAAEDAPVVMVVVPTDGGWWQASVAQGQVTAMNPMDTTAGP